MLTTMEKQFRVSVPDFIIFQSAGGSVGGAGSLSVHRSVNKQPTDLRGERFDLYLVAVEDRNL